MWQNLAEKKDTLQMISMLPKSFFKQFYMILNTYLHYFSTNDFIRVFPHKIVVLVQCWIILYVHNCDYKYHNPAPSTSCTTPVFRKCSSQVEYEYPGLQPPRILLHFPARVRKYLYGRPLTNFFPLARVCGRKKSKGGIPGGYLEYNGTSGGPRLGYRKLAVLSPPDLTLQLLLAF
jgi:hypothetical protein